MPAVNEDLRALAYKICEQREVPLLVTDLIAAYLDKRDLLAINRLSRDLNVQANAIIYRSVFVNLDGGELSIRKATLLFRTLLTSKTAAKDVCVLSLAGDPLVHWRTQNSRVEDSESIEAPLRGQIPPNIYANLADFTQRETQSYDEIARSTPAMMRPLLGKIFVWELCLHVVRLTTCLQELSISSDYFRFPDFRSTLQEMAKGGLLRTLRSCSLCLDLLHGKRRHASAVRDWDNALLVPFLSPAIKSAAAVVTLKPEATRQLRPGATLITRLVLHHYQIQESDLSALLAATTTLQYLEYRATVDYAWLTSPRRKEATSRHGVGLEPLYDALHHVSDSLQELHTYQDFDEDSIHFNQSYASGHEPPFHRRDEMSSLQRLHTLTIPYATLLGWNRKECDWSWDQILPSSLRHVILTDNLSENSFVDCWTDESLMPVISGLLEWLSARVGQGSKATEFGLHLFQLTTDFNEPVRQELSQMCEARGLRCSIEKVQSDRNRAPTSQLARGRGRGNLTRGRGRGRGT